MKVVSQQRDTISRSSHYHPYRRNHPPSATATTTRARKTLEWSRSGWDPSLRFHVGSSISNTPYVILDKIGEGTSARVLLCQDTESDREVVIKVQRWLEHDYIVQEVDILRSVSQAFPSSSYPNIPIIRLLDHFIIPEDNTSPHTSSPSSSSHTSKQDNLAEVLVFEKADLSLWDYMRTVHPGGIPLSQLRTWARSMMQALDMVHSLDITHADIKPENWVLARGDGGSLNIKLIDFGLAAYPHSRKPDVVGTRQYSGPEVVLQLGWSTHLDVWATACLLVEMATGVTLFRCGDDKEQIKRFEDCLGPLPRYMVRDSSVAQPWFGPDGWLRGRDAFDRIATHRPLRETLTRALRHEAKSEVADFINMISRMLHYIPDCRLTAKECLDHPFLQSSETSPLPLPGGGNN
eukprot:TRINITY_DN2166_c0_g2_i2.p1 TRINITY_DN2166_c0_g2~~TRINITY_DN2166_c0_g2_i2.p1  ORF type:complete len:406 (-),score=55.33 TRINITY_DN2166_c0_g2_i2:38-1255(-)